MAVKGLRGALTLLGVAAAFGMAASWAGAAPLVTVDISSVGIYDVYHIEGEATPNPDGTLGLSGIGYGTNFNCDWSITVNTDPSISGTFNLTNLSTSTQTFILSVTLPIAPLSAPTRMGGFFGDVTYTDANSDSSVTLATVAANPFYRALIDALGVQDLGSFTVTAFGGPGVFGTVSRQAFGEPIPSATGPAANATIGIRTQFSLTGGDRVAIPVFFQVEAGVPTPEPHAALLIGLGVAGLAAARKRHGA